MLAIRGVLLGFVWLFGEHPLGVVLYGQDLILLLAHADRMADRVRVNVSGPDTYQNVVSHFVHSTLTDLLVLDLFQSTVLSTDCKQ